VDAAGVVDRMESLGVEFTLDPWFTTGRVIAATWPWPDTPELAALRAIWEADAAGPGAAPDAQGVVTVEAGRRFCRREARRLGIPWEGP
jgi:hypothetical protein